MADTDHLKTMVHHLRHDRRVGAPERVDDYQPGSYLETHARHMEVWHGAQ
jgi:hypothetical protein